MPELPEVETIKNELSPHILNHVINGIVIKDPGIVQPLSPEEFSRQTTGQGIVAVGRRGKYLLLRLSSGKTLIMHLRMTGSLLLNPPHTDKYSRAVITLDNSSRIVFTDRRRLGVIRLVDDSEEVISKLGIEPFDKHFTAPFLKQSLKNRSAPIKALLLDQHLIAGIGNMYADEALFAAGIYPLKKACDLSSREINRLHQAIRAVLQKAIDNRGASVDTYKRPDGDTGTAQEEFNVAHRSGKNCPVCGTPISRIAIRNRGCYYCPRCQKSSGK